MATGDSVHSEVGPADGGGLPLWVRTLMSLAGVALLFGPAVAVLWPR